MKKIWKYRGVRFLALLLALALYMPAPTVQAAAKKSVGKKSASKSKSKKNSKTKKKKDSSKVKLDKYIKSESRYLVMAWVPKKGEKIPVRSQPSGKSKILYKIQYGDALVVNPNRIQKGRKTAWVPCYLHSKKNTGKAKYGKWKTVYIHIDNVKLSILDKAKMKNPYNKYSAKAIRYGLRFLGIHHENGGIINGVQKGTNMKGGVACSYFFNRCYRAAGKSMPSSFMDDILRTLKPIKASQLRPGDCIFYFDGKKLGHVAMYLGNNFMLSASGHYGQHYPNGGVCIKRVNYGSRGLFNAKFGRVRT